MRTQINPNISVIHSFSNCSIEFCIVKALTRDLKTLSISTLSRNSGSVQKMTRLDWPLSKTFSIFAGQSETRGFSLSWTTTVSLQEAVRLMWTAVNLISVLPTDKTFSNRLPHAGCEITNLKSFRIITIDYIVVCLNR